MVSWKPRRKRENGLQIQSERDQLSWKGRKEIAVEAKGRHFRKAFVCSDPDLIRFNVTKKVLDVLEEAGLDYEVYSDIKANPTIENVQHGVAAFKASGADYIIAIGGGSSMDTAKAIGIIIANPQFPSVRRRQVTRGHGTDTEPMRAHHRGAHDGGNRGRGHDQLRHHRCREEEEVRVRRPA